MKHKKMFFLLLLEAAACIVFCLLHVQFSGLFSQAAAFPFEQIGLGLRALSLSGSAGNAAAVALYILLGLTPLLAGCVLYATGKADRADLLLAGLSILLFFVLYDMVNPGLLRRMAVPESGKWVCGAVFYSAFFGYLVLRALGVYLCADIPRLQKGLIRLLWLLAAAFVYIVFGSCFGQLLSSLQALQEAGQAASGMVLPQVSSLSVSLSFLFLLLQFLIAALPYILDIWIIFLAVHTVGELEEDRYSDGAVQSVAKLADFCVQTLAVSTIMGVVFHILQYAFSSKLYQVHITIAVPVASVVFVLLILMFARIMQEDQKLKQDHDLII